MNDKRAPCPTRIPPSIPPPPSQTNKIAEGRAIPPEGPKAMPIPKAPAGQPPAAPQIVAKAPPAARAAQTSEDVKREKKNANAAMIRQMKADMAKMQQTLDSVIEEEDEAAADEEMDT